MNAAIRRLAGLGATIVENTNIPYIDQVSGPEYTALLSEFKHDIAVYLSTRPAGPRTLADLIAFNSAHAGEEMPWFGQDVFLAAEQSGPLTDPAYITARRTATTLAQRGINETLRKYHLTAILAPTNSPAWTTDLIDGDHFLLGSSTPAAVSGYASITLPAGYNHQLLIGMSLIAGKFSEPTLIGLAYWWEHATQIRHKPRLLTSLGQ
jgi:amidase